MPESNVSIKSARGSGRLDSFHCEMATRFGSHQYDRQPENDSRSSCFHVADVSEISAAGDMASRNSQARIYLRALIGRFADQDGGA
jgi:hypothetical protein